MHLGLHNARHACTRSFYPTDVPFACMFNAASSQYLTRTPSADGNKLKFTISVGVKRGKLGVLQLVYGAYGTNGAYWGGLAFEADDSLSFRTTYAHNGYYNLKTSKVFRDCSAHMHICVAVDLANATAAHKVRLYINGVEETSFAADDRAAIPANTTYLTTMGQYAHYAGGGGGTSLFFDGYISDLHVVNDAALTPSSFGQASPLSSGVWVPKSFAGVYGTNGFHQAYANAAALGTDTSGNGNTYTSTNMTSANQTADTPTNCACTIDALDYGSSSLVLQAGGLRPLLSSYGAWRSTSAFSSGKWYWEFKAEVLATGWYPQVGVAKTSVPIPTNTWTWGSSALGAIVICPDGRILEDTANPRTLTSYVANDIIAVAYDADNGALYLGKVSGGVTTWMNSGVPTSGASKTGAASTYFQTGTHLTPCGGGGYLGSTGLFNFGATPFAGTPPAGYNKLTATDMPAPLPAITLAGSFTGNASTNGPVVRLGGVPETLGINGNAVTWGTHALKLANGFKVISTAAAYNAAGSNTFAVTATSNMQYPFNNAQVN